MTLLRRVLLVFSFALFWGGLTFYTGFVVRISHDVVSDSMEGGLITQRVTELLQWLALVAVTFMFWESFATWKLFPRRAAIMIACCVAVGCSLAGLFVVHADLDAVISIETAEVIDRDSFRINHRHYNQLTTVEWIASVCFLPIAISTWQAPKLRSETP